VTRVLISDIVIVFLSFCIAILSIPLNGDGELSCRGVLLTATDILIRRRDGAPTGVSEWRARGATAAGATAAGAAAQARCSVWLSDAKRKSCRRHGNGLLVVR